MTDEDIQEFEHSPEELKEDLKAMGATYVKLGQLLSTRPDLLPLPYTQALADLQDDVEEIPYEEVEKIFREETGQRISKAFENFDPQPIGSASIGQVHKATLLSGKKVAVKIQRPNIRKRFVEDLDTLLDLAGKAEKISETARNYAVKDVIEELRYVLLKELDYTLEAQNLETLKDNLKEFKHLVVPQPVLDYCSGKVLTMEYVEGKKIVSISPFKKMDLEAEALVDDLVKGYLKQIIVDGFAHADPHPGNIHLTKNNQIALMDLGMVARFTSDMRNTILKLMVGLSNNDSQKIGDILLQISNYDEKKADIEFFRKNIHRKIQENENTRAEDLQTGRIILEMNQIAAQQGIHIPVELNMLGKILLNMDQIVAFLTPHYDLNQTVRNYVQELMQRNMTQQMKPENWLQTLLETKELTENLPYRLNKISENLANNNMQIKIDAIDEDRFTDALQKVANRITLGLILAALIIGAAMLMKIPTFWTIGGYPAFAIILFIGAATVGIYLIYLLLFRNK